MLTLYHPGVLSYPPVVCLCSLWASWVNRGEEETESGYLYPQTHLWCRQVQVLIPLSLYSGAEHVDLIHMGSDTLSGGESHLEITNCGIQ